jgi:hypothetical protein
MVFNQLNKFISYPMSDPEGDWHLQERAGAHDVGLRAATASGSIRGGFRTISVKEQLCSYTRKCRRRGRTEHACQRCLQSELPLILKGGLMADADRRSALVELAAYGQELRI